VLKLIPSFELSQEFSAEAGQLFRILSDAERWPEGSIARVLVVREPGYVQLAFLDRSRARVEVTSLGIGLCQVKINHELLPDAEAVTSQKKAWQTYFKQLRSQVER
jgi:hypothetical protein